MCRRSSGSRPAGLPPKGILIDSLGSCAIVCAALTYFGLFAVAVIVGVLGPTTFSSASNSAADLPIACGDPTSCVVSWTGTLTDMTTYHQFMWLDATYSRPATYSGELALLNLDVTYDQVYQVDLLALSTDGSPPVILAQNQSHVAPVHFAPGAASSDPVILFATQVRSAGWGGKGECGVRASPPPGHSTAPPHTHTHIPQEIRYPTYRLAVRFFQPLGPFSQQANLDPASSAMHFTMSFVNKSYTSFEVGWKMFFVTVSILLWLMYSGLLCCGPGVREEVSAKRLPSTIEQAYVWWLGLGLIWFNDPFFVLTINNPSIVTSGWVAFCTVTFLASLLMFWLVMFDLSRLQGEGGAAWQLSTDASNSLGACFWLPKVVLVRGWGGVGEVALLKSLQRVMLRPRLGGAWLPFQSPRDATRRLAVAAPARFW